jgi:hypothetical protein
VTIDSLYPSQPAAGQPAAPVPITGLQAGEAIVAIDVRPSNGELYGFSSQSRLYRITPPATQVTVNALATLIGSGPVVGIAATSARWEMDFDPVSDRLKLARTQPGVIFTVNPNDATLDLVNTFPFDPVGLAQHLPFETDPSWLYALDATNGRLVTISGSNANAFANASYLMLMGTQAFDISPIDGVAFYAANGFGDDFTTLFTINLRTAEIRALGRIFAHATNTNVSIRSLAVASPGVVHFVAPPVAVAETEGSLTIQIERFNGTNGPMWVTCYAGDVTATRPADYLDAPRVLLGPNVAFGSCVFPIVNDTLLEGPELFKVSLMHLFGGPTLGSPRSTEITIVDDELAGNAAPVVTITGPT